MLKWLSKSLDFGSQNCKTPVFSQLKSTCSRNPSVFFLFFIISWKVSQGSGGGRLAWITEREARSSEFEPRSSELGGWPVGKVQVRFR